MKKILLSGFEPFGKLSTNPTMDIIARSAHWNIEGVKLDTVILPVVYNECAALLIKKVEEVNPDIIVSLGVAAGRSMIAIERIGVNIQDTDQEESSGDNRGDQPMDNLIEEQGEDGLFSTLPNRQMAKMLSDHGIPAQISNSAGTYICNNTLYSMMHYIKKKGLPIKAGFVHVPATPEMMAQTPNRPSMSIDVQEKAIKLIVEYLVK